MLEKQFQISARKSSVRIEIIAGFTSFFAMAYIILVNPDLISRGDPQLFNAIFFATCISAAIGTLLMGLIANIPFAQAPGMGLNAFFAFTAMPALAALITHRELSIIEQYQMTLPLVFYSGIIFTLVSVVGWREKIINGIPLNIKMAISGGIGLFIAYLGLQNSGLIVPNPDTQVALIPFADFANHGHEIHGALISLMGLFIITILYAKKVKGAVLFGILSSTLLAFLTGYSKMPESFSFNIAKQASDYMSVSFFHLDFLGPFQNGNIKDSLTTIITLLLAFTMVNMFDSLGTIFGVAKAANMVDKDGNVQGLNKGLLADALGTAVGALFGSSTLTTFVESAAGIGEGGKTGFSSIITALLFLLALVFAPIIVLIPSVATAPALIFVGCLMISNIQSVDFKDPTEAMPAFLTIIMMPLTYSIANGIAFGLISYVVIKLISGKVREIKLPTVIVSVLFILQFILR